MIWREWLVKTIFRLIYLYFKGRWIERRVRLGGKYTTESRVKIIGFVWDYSSMNNLRGMKLKLDFPDKIVLIPISKVMRDYERNTWYFQEG